MSVVKCSRTKTKNTGSSDSLEAVLLKGESCQILKFDTLFGLYLSAASGSKLYGSWLTIDTEFEQRTMRVWQNRISNLVLSLSISLPMMLSTQQTKQLDSGGCESCQRREWWRRGTCPHSSCCGERRLMWENLGIRLECVEENVVYSEIFNSAIIIYVKTTCFKFASAGAIHGHFLIVKKTLWKSRTNE
jgi:hypothetical protein